MINSLFRASSLGLAAVLLSCSAHAQSIWKWRDAEGRVQISDRPPAASVPDSAIIQRPSNAPQRQSAQASGDRADAAASAPSAPKVDNELEAKKRKQQADKQAADQAADKAAKDKQTAQKAETCRRARNDLNAVESGMRIARANDRGEREVLDDSARASESQRLRQLMNDNCQ